MIANGGSVDDDEAFARQLQQEEFNNSRLVSLFSQQARRQAGQNRDDSVNSEAPLLVGGNGNQGNGQQAMGPMQPNAEQQERVRSMQNNIQLIQSVEQARSSSPRFVLCVVIFGLIECIVTATIVAVNFDLDCGSAGGLSIEWWLLVFSIRHILGVPIMIWDYKLNILQETPAINQRRLALKKFQNWIKIATFIWWIFGQFLLYDPKSVASEQCPSLYYYCIAVIVFTYLGISLPLLCLVGLCICYPCIHALLRYLNNQSASGNTIEENTVLFKYDGIASVRSKIEENYPATQTELNEDEDLQCSICFCEYEKDEDVRLLPCGHLYHKDCVDTWLGSHKRICPLCRHDITRRVNAAEAAV